MLSELIAKAKAWLGRTPVETKPATDAVVADDFDRMIFDDLMAEAPALRQVVEELSQEHEHAEDLFRDTLMNFWQQNPTIREQHEMADSHLVNHAVAEMVAELPEIREARTYTAFDRYGSALATIGVGEQLTDYVRQANERQREAEEKKREAEAALEEARQALEDALQLAEGLDEDDATEEEIEDALAGLGTAQQGVEQAEQQVEQAQQEMVQAATPPPDLSQKIADSLERTEERLDEEADLMDMAGYSEGDVQRMSFTERARLADRLRSTKLARFRKMIGRMKRLANGYRSKKIEHGRDEVVDVELSGDLSRVLTAEILLSDIDEVRELEFLQAMDEGRLLSRKFVGTEEAGDGPIVICVDESSSMDGPNEAWAKAFALALYDQARKSGRDLVWIGYSSSNMQKKWYFPKGQGSLEDLIEAVEHFYCGMTDFEEPLKLALESCVKDFDANGRGKADIVFITDGGSHVSPAFLERFKAEKERIGVRVFGIGVDQDPGGMAVFADTLHHVSDLATGNDAAEIFATI